MSQATAYEQYMLELMNADRSAAGAQPLAFSSALNDAADNHTAWMLSTGIFSHTGVNGTDPGSRMSAAGYRFQGSWGWAENIAWASTRAPAGYADEVKLLEANLMASPGHHANLVNDSYREAGVGYQIGQFSGFEAAMVTQDFAVTAGDPFLTGVAYADKDHDHFYSVGEGLSGATVTAVNTATGQSFTTTSGDAGGYSLQLAAGIYKVTFSETGFASTSLTETVGAKNVKADWVDPAAASTPAPTPSPTPTPTPTPTPAPSPAPAPDPTHQTGTAGADTLRGTALADTLSGLNGADKLYGFGGDDHLDGGAGPDLLFGGTGHDVLTGGAGRDVFVIDAAPGPGNLATITDFSTSDDTIRLDHTVFTGLRLGALPTTAFWTGAAAHDATDRVIYDSHTGAVWWDADGTGALKAVQIAQLAPNLHVSSFDFSIV